MKLGVFTPVFAGLDAAAMLKKVKSFNGIEAVELGTGGWPGSDHLNLERLKEPCHLRDYRQSFADAGLSISALSCHSNPLHPDPSVAKAADEVFRETVPPPARQHCWLTPLRVKPLHAEPGPTRGIRPVVWDPHRRR